LRIGVKFKTALVTGPRGNRQSWRHLDEVVVRRRAGDLVCGVVSDTLPFCTGLFGRAWRMMVKQLRERCIQVYRTSSTSAKVLHIWITDMNDVKQVVE
jgi:hypothetical protein